MLHCLVLKIDDIAVCHTTLYSRLRQNNLATLGLRFTKLGYYHEYLSTGLAGDQKEVG